MSLASVTGIFPGATVLGGDLTIPSGTITSFDPVSTTNPGGYELVYGLLETMHSKVGDNYSNMSSSVSTSTVGGNLLRRRYTFSVDLDFTDSVLDSLNVTPTGWY